MICISGNRVQDNSMQTLIQKLDSEENRLAPSSQEPHAVRRTFPIPALFRGFEKRRRKKLGWTLGYISHDTIVNCNHTQKSPINNFKGIRGCPNHHNFFFVTDQPMSYLFRSILTLGAAIGALLPICLIFRRRGGSNLLRASDSSACRWRT